MNITDEMLEILIGKYIDGEITPSEQKMLDGAMEKDAKVRELAEQLTELHEASTEAITGEVIETGKSAEQIIDLAWEAKAPRKKKLGSGVWRFAAGLAAGLLIGLTLHFVLAESAKGGGDEIQPEIVADASGNRTEIQQIAPPVRSRDIIRNVDYYSFTDKEGGRWLVEGLREGMARPAVHYGNL